MIKLTMWHNNRDQFYLAVCNEVIEELEKKYPNVSLQMEALDYYYYKEFLANIESADELPDIFMVLGDMSFRNLMSRGFVSCLDDVYPQYEEKLAGKMCEAYSLEGKKYAAPSMMNAVVMYANMDLLSEFGYTEVPATWEEMTECCDKLLAAGKIPFALSGYETWCVEEYLESIALRTCGVEELRKIFYGEATWNNKGIVEAVDLLLEMKQKGYFGEGFENVNNDRLRDMFMYGNEYAFYVNGSWNVLWFEELDRNIAVAPFPVFDDTKSEYMQLIGGPGDAFAVSAASPNAEIAGQYAMDFSMTLSRHLYLAGDYYPVWAVDYDCPEASVMRKQVTEMLHNIESFLLYGETVMQGEKNALYLEVMSKIMSGSMTGQQFAEYMAALIR